MAGFPSSCELIIKPYFRNIIIYILKYSVLGSVSIHSESIEKIQLEISPKRKVPQMPLLGGKAAVGPGVGPPKETALCQIVLLNAPATKSYGAADKDRTTFGAVSASLIVFVADQRNAQASRRYRSWRPRTTPAKSAMSATTLLSSPQSWARWQGPGEVRRACFGELAHGSALSRDARGSSKGARGNSHMAGRISVVKFDWFAMCTLMAF